MTFTINFASRSCTTVKTSITVQISIVLKAAKITRFLVERGDDSPKCCEHKKVGLAGGDDRNP